MDATSSPVLQRYSCLGNSTALGTFSSWAGSCGQAEVCNILTLLLKMLVLMYILHSIIELKLMDVLKQLDEIEFHFEFST